jgi:hypothetical protein
MKHYKMPLILVIMLQVGQVTAQNYFSNLLPTVPGVASARQLSLGFASGGCGATALALQVNPSLAFLAKERFKISTGFGFAHWNERRTYPILDSFGDYLADNTYVVNSTLVPAYNTGVLVKPHKYISLGINWVIGYQGKFVYEEEVRGSVTGQYNRDPLVGYHRLQMENKLQQLELGLATKLNNIQVGIALFKRPTLQNANKWEVEVLQADVRLAADTTTVYQQKAQVDPLFKTILGLSWRANPHLDLGLAYQLPYTVESTKPAIVMVNDLTQHLPQAKVNQLEAIKKLRQSYPALIRFSASYQPVNIIPTKFIVELEFQPWSQFKQKVTLNPNAYISASDSVLFTTAFKLRDVLNWKLGIEHNLFSGIDFRAGFFSERSPLGNELNRIWFTGGLGSRFGKLYLDFGAALATCEYKYPDLFIIPSEQRLSYDTVHEFWWLAQLNLHYEL